MLTIWELLDKAFRLEILKEHLMLPKTFIKAITLLMYIMSLNYLLRLEGSRK